jgi:hypothetical protein
MESIKSTDSRPLAADPRIFIEDIGYKICEDTQHPGRWIWTSPSDSSDVLFPCASSALDSAWGDAVFQAMRISMISETDWKAMDFDEKKVAITYAITDGGLPDFESLGVDTRMKWLGEVRAHYPSIGPKEVFRLGAQAYRELDGVFPRSRKGLQSEGLSSVGDTPRG